MKIVKEVNQELDHLVSGHFGNSTVEDRPVRVEVDGRLFDISKITTKTNDAVVIELEGI